MSQITLDQIKAAFDNITGITIDDVIGISYQVCSQVSFKQGITDVAVVVLKESMPYVEYDIHQYNRDFVYIDLYKMSQNGTPLDNFDHDSVRKGDEVTTQMIVDVICPELIKEMSHRNWKMFWGQPHHEKEEVVDFFSPTLDSPTYEYGENRDT